MKCRTVSLALEKASTLIPRRSCQCRLYRPCRRHSTRSSDTTGDGARHHTIFDHLGHIYDPAVTLTRFRWNVRDEPEDDLNGNGVIETEEIDFEFETDDPNAVFRYRFTENPGWDDVDVSR